jgi:glycosyltransferase involved in cell wall biosynthesis
MDRSRKASVTLCGIVRDEGPYLLEWIAWYKFMGFDQIVIYDNASRDNSGAILAALHRAGEIRHRPWPDVPDQQPQLPAYRDAVARCSTEWIAFLDADEFLVLHASPHIAGFLERLPDECSAVAFNQRFFGSSSLQSYDDRLVIERFTLTARPDHDLNHWVKSISRAHRIASIDSPHSCELTSGYHADPGGSPCEVVGASRARAISFADGQYNHYILKSLEEYRRKRAKGRCDVAPGDSGRFDKYTDEFFSWHNENVVQDDSASRWAESVRAERDRLEHLCPGDGAPAGTAAMRP